MYSLLVRLLLLCTLAFSMQSAYAEATAATPGSNQTGAPDPDKRPYVMLNVGVELAGLEAAAQDAAEGLTLIGKSLNSLASNPELAPKQRERLLQTLSKLDKLSINLSDGMEQLPETVRMGMLPVTEAGGELSSQIKRIIIIASIALILIILAALLAVYYFVLAPGTRSIIETTQLLNKLADTLESTAQIVEKSSQQNLQVLSALRTEDEH